MSQKLLVNDFKWIENLSDEEFIKSYHEKSKDGHFLEVDVESPKKLHEFHNDLPFLPRKKKQTNIEKVEKLIANLHDKKEFVIHIKKFKTSFNSWISFENSA